METQKKLDEAFGRPMSSFMNGVNDKRANSTAAGTSLKHNQKSRVKSAVSRK
jgi:hypothetical protein